MGTRGFVDKRSREKMMSAEDGGLKVGGCFKMGELFAA